MLFSSKLATFIIISITVPLKFSIGFYSKLLPDGFETIFTESVYTCHLPWFAFTKEDIVSKPLPAL